ncbi:DUF4870 domain-containing protein [Mesonia sp. K7]|uniref:DUF4870 domain-containing protein n=1 Tax=Mesonia sp. K7 TaxID=2218606 RepID=UPI000DAA99AE|nr:DUF4870 domain-containing protein [Mesonia sp. K7]PZD79513.1 hypothetical protein DNG35_00455 [Mesonia sp. K7]
MTPLASSPFFQKEYEAETASNSYIMSLIGIMVGLPLPIINLLATFIFYLANKNKTYFIRWHCTQALLSQISLLPINSIAFWWTIRVVYIDLEINNAYLIYMGIVIFFNLIEFIATIYTAIQTRKGKHIKWIIYGNVVDRMCKSNT